MVVVNLRAAICIQPAEPGAALAAGANFPVHPVILPWPPTCNYRPGRGAMAQNGVITEYDDLGYPLNARLTSPLTFAGGVVKTTPGRLIRVVLTTAFVTTGNLTFYNNALGTATGTPLLAILTASGVIGAVFVVDLPVAYGISAVNTSLSAGAVTVSYS